jgi:abhydrolase domain-containing protein 6
MPAFLTTLFVLLTLWLVYESAPGRVYQLAMAAERRFARVRDRRLAVGRHTIAYLDGGRGQPIVALHGFGADRYHWPRFARRFTRRYRVIAPDLPGFGDSSRLPDERYDLASQVARLHAFLNALALDGPVHLIGNSMGGHLAAAYLRAHPDRVRSLALFDAAGVDPRADTEFIAALRNGDNLLLATSRADFRRLTAMMFVRQPFIPSRVLDHLGEQAAARRDWNARVFDQYWEAFDNLEHGPPLPVVPSMIAWGREDRVLPVQDVAVFSQLLPHAEVHVLEHTGHLPMLEHPAIMASHYARFLASARPAEAGTATAEGAAPVRQDS